MSTTKPSNIPVVGGIVVGILAWVAGYATTYVRVAPDIVESPLNRIVEQFEGEPAEYEMVGWVFYNAHFVPTRFRDLPVVGDRTTSFIAEGEFTVLLYVVPVAFLLLGGLALARYSGATELSDGAVAGAAALPGYLVLTVAGIVLFQVTLGGATGTPDPLAAVFLAGVVYPLVCAGLGGAIGGVIWNPRSRSSEDESPSTERGD